MPALDSPVIGPLTRKGFLIKVNHHRHGFNGTICQQAALYQCGAHENFRVNKCAAGHPECFDLQLFAAQEASFSRRLNFDGSALLEEVRSGDLILFWTYQTHGRLNTNPILVGLYVVDTLDVNDTFMPYVYTFYPR